MLLRILAIFAVPVAAVLTVFVVLGFFWWPAFLLAIPVAALVLWFLHRRSDAVIISRLGARPMGQIEGERLVGTVENLSLQSGIDQPKLWVVESDAINLAAIDGVEPALIATSGLLNSLGVLEMEGVVAHALTKISSGAVKYETFAASLGSLVTGRQRELARSWGTGEAGVLEFDLSGVGLTRYPPGLRSALQQIDGRSTDIAGGESLGAAWLVPPASQRIPLEHRIEVLWEL